MNLSEKIHINTKFSFDKRDWSLSTCIWQVSSYPYTIVLRASNDNYMLLFEQAVIAHVLNHNFHFMHKNGNEALLGFGSSNQSNESEMKWRANIVSKVQLGFAVCFYVDLINYLPKQ